MSRQQTSSLVQKKGPGVDLDRNDRRVARLLERATDAIKRAEDPANAKELDTAVEHLEDAHRITVESLQFLSTRASAGDARPRESGYDQALFDGAARIRTELTKATRLQEEALRAALTGLRATRDRFRAALSERADGSAAARPSEQGGVA